eukprot:8073016-Pyramimonas_sp.AAC.1
MAARVPTSDFSFACADGTEIQAGPRAILNISDGAGQLGACTPSFVFPIAHRAMAKSCPALFSASWGTS